MTIGDLKRALAQRQKQLAKLTKQREKIAKELRGIDAEIAKISGGDVAVGGGRGTRARNDRPLPVYMEEVMAKNGKPMRVGEIVDAVKAAGYKTTSPAFKNIVNQQLIKERKRFTAVERGLYALVGSKK